MNSKYYKKYIEKMIDSKPSQLILKRETRQSDGYGGYTSSTTEIPIKGSVYETKSRRGMLTEAGIVYTGIRISKLLVSYDTDIKVGDQFIYQDSVYKVIFVDEYMDICKQVEIEVVG